MALRWGIVGAGKISHDFVSAMQTYSLEKHQIVGIAARSKINAYEFAQLHKIPKSYEGYEEMAKDKEIDVVYIGVVAIHHRRVAKLMLDHGKHVLCEMPLGMNKIEAKELLEYAREKKLFLMEGIWTRFFPVYHKLRELLNEGIIGDVLYIRIDFGYPLNIEQENMIETSESAVLAVGSYILQLAQFVFKGLKPVSIVSLGSINKYGSNDLVAGAIMYPGGRTSVVSCNVRIALDNTAFIYGTKGVIKIPDFWCPLKIITPDETLEYALPSSDAIYNYHNSAGLAFEAEEVRCCIMKGLLESPIQTHEDSLELAEMRDIFEKNAVVTSAVCNTEDGSKFE